jgi:type II secretory pathway component PulF
MLNAIGRIFMWGVWGMAGLFALAVTVGALSVLVPVLGPLNGLGGLIFFLVVGQCVSRIRRNRVQTVQRYLSQAVELNLPLTRILQAAQVNEGWFTRRGLRRLHRRLTAGESLGTAVVRAVPDMTARQAALIQRGDELGRLPQALHRLQRQGPDRGYKGPIDPLLAGSYALAITLTSFIVAGGFSILIAPKMRAIYADFDIAMPALTQWVFETMPAFGWVLMAAGALMGLVLVGWSLRMMLVGEKPGRAVLAPIVDRVAWWLPIAHGIARDRGLGEAFYLMHQSVEAGHTLNHAVHEAAALPINGVLRRKLQRFASELDAGHSMRDAAKASGLPAFVVGMLSTVEASGDTESVFRFLNRAYDTRFSRSIQIAGAAGWPALLLALGVLIAVIAAGMMLMIVRLMEAVNTFHTAGL